MKKGSTETWKARRENSVNRTETKGRGNTTSRLTLGIGLPGRIRMDDQVIYATVSSRGKSYQIEFSLDRDSSEISTTVTLQVGEKLNLGDVVETIDRKNKEINIAKRNYIFQGEEKPKENLFPDDSELILNK